VAACRDCGSTRLIDGTPRVARARVVSTEPLGIQFIGDGGSDATPVMQLDDDEIIVVEVSPNVWAQLPALAKDTPADKFPTPSLEQLTKMSVRVSWNVALEGTGYDVQAADDAMGTNARSVATGATGGHADDTGLDEQSTHYYRIGRSSKWGPWASITLTLDNTGIPGLDTALDVPPGADSCAVGDGALTICWPAPAPAPSIPCLPTTGWAKCGTLASAGGAYNMYKSGDWVIYPWSRSATAVILVGVGNVVDGTLRPVGTKISMGATTVTVGNDWDADTVTAATYCGVHEAWQDTTAVSIPRATWEDVSNLTVTCPEPAGGPRYLGTYSQSTQHSSFWINGTSAGDGIAVTGTGANFEVFVPSTEAQFTEETWPAGTQIVIDGNALTVSIWDNLTRTETQITDPYTGESLDVHSYSMRLAVGTAASWSSCVWRAAPEPAGNALYGTYDRTLGTTAQWDNDDNAAYHLLSTSDASSADGGAGYLIVATADKVNLPIVWPEGAVFTYMTGPGATTRKTVTFPAFSAVSVLFEDAKVLQYIFQDSDVLSSINAWEKPVTIGPPASSRFGDAASLRGLGGCG